MARSFFEDVLDKGKLEDYAKSHAPDFVAHSEGRLASLEEDMAAAREQRKALPDMRVKVNQIVAEGDLVSVYWTASGTNTAAGWGIPATGKSVSVSGMTFFRFERGLIQEEWSVFNDVLDHEAARPDPDEAEELAPPGSQHAAVPARLQHAVLARDLARSR